MENGMTGGKNWNKEKLTYLCIHLTSCFVGMIARYLMAAWKF